MPRFTVISREHHAAKRWQRYTSYAFAAADAVVPLVAHELPPAVLSLPIGFIQAGDQFIPVAVFGLKSGQNLFVTPDGRWLGGYIPAAYRGYPFALASTEEGQQVLCIDEDSGLLSETEGEAFFGEDGQPAQGVKDVLDFLTQVAQNRQATQRICAVLQQHNLVQPWLIKMQSEEGEKSIEGLFRIDEAALNQLPAEAFEDLRQGGGLPIAYCQLLSMRHLPRLGALAQAHAQTTAPLPQTPSGELSLEFLNDNGTIHFGNLH